MTFDQDNAILERIRSGDNAACDDCVRQHAPAVYRFALRFMRNEADAEDVMQETFLNAFKGIDQFDGRSKLRTWLYRIAYNAAMMRYRRKQPEVVSLDQAGDPDEGALIPNRIVEWEAVAADEMIKLELRLEMERAVRDLPDKLRATFVLRDIEELSTDEAAEALDITPEAVKTRLHRARLWLRERLSEYFDRRVTQE
jgi:RNA polymerase sigma-70 factor, ECF subfamily